MPDSISRTGKKMTHCDAVDTLDRDDLCVAEAAILTTLSGAMRLDAAIGLCNKELNVFPPESVGNLPDKRAPRPLIALEGKSDAAVAVGHFASGPRRFKPITSMQSAAARRGRLLDAAHHTACNCLLPSAGASIGVDSCRTIITSTRAGPVLSSARLNAPSSWEACSTRHASRPKLLAISANAT
jgi:hypothetical protein